MPAGISLSVAEDVEVELAAAEVPVADLMDDTNVVGIAVAAVVGAVVELLCATLTLTAAAMAVDVDCMADEALAVEETMTEEEITDEEATEDELLEEEESPSHVKRAGPGIVYVVAFVIS